ncbi:MAG: dynamin family protein [Methanoregula sp.]|nr:dynamin family protein [Methanoregula sp.]
MDDTSTPTPLPSQSTTTISVPENLPEILKTERRRFEDMDSRYAVHAKRLDELEKRLSQGRFHLAVLGQVKRGKSTLLNALLGEDVLPSSVVPLTALPTFVQYGEQRLLTVRYNDNRPDTVMKGEPTQWLNKQLMGFVTEDANPKNENGVLQVEITHPAAILRDVVLIDTPGIGSTYRHNTEATMNFLPQCDAALFVISADPPITEVEVTFLKEIRSRIGQLFFVLNKVDYLTDAERETAVGFYRTVLTRDAGIEPGTRIFPTSARKGLLAKESGDAQQWEESGLAEVFDHLITFLAKEKNRVLRDAIGRKAFDVFQDVHLQIGLENRALELPLAQLECRLAVFDKKIVEAKEQRIHAQDILTGDQKRVYAQLEAYIENLRSPLRERLTTIAEAAISASPQSPEHTAQQAVADAIPAWFERELGRISAMMDQEIAARLKDHEQRADDLIESIRKAAAELFDIPYHAPRGERAYEPVRKPYWVEHDWDSSFSPVSAEVIGRFLPKSLRESLARDRLKKQIDMLVIRNLENLRWATIQNIDTAFRKFSSDLDTNLGLTIDATQGAIRLALEERTRHEENVAGRIDELKKTATDIQCVIDTFGSG